MLIFKELLVPLANISVSCQKESCDLLFALSLLEDVSGNLQEFKGENCKFPKAISDLVNAANKNEEIIYRGVELFYKNPKEMTVVKELNQTKDMYIEKLIE